ncbi:MAG: type II toxin-antitoxin system VapC family toxin [Thermoanaerobaculia bacterium]|nr:type II toxin-antitoxin system VapC family toxin [Thermoanaerobaculia bacterium]
MKLWDTNVVSELCRPSPDPAVLTWVESEKSIAISVVTVDELTFGPTWRPRPRINAWLETFFADYCEVLDITEVIARLAGELRGRLRARGEVRTQADTWIAATARVHGLPLVTRNVKDFQGCGIEIVDPFE